MTGARGRRTGRLATSLVAVAGTPASAVAAAPIPARILPVTRSAGLVLAGVLVVGLIGLGATASRRRAHRYPRPGTAGSVLDAVEALLRERERLGDPPAGLSRLRAAAAAARGTGDPGLVLAELRERVDRIRCRDRDRKADALVDRLDRRQRALAALRRPDPARWTPSQSDAP